MNKLTLVLPKKSLMETEVGGCDEGMKHVDLHVEVLKEGVDLQRVHNGCCFWQSLSVQLCSSSLTLVVNK